MGVLKRNKGLGRFDTVIGSKTVLNGSLVSEEGVCIEGVVEGTVECRGNVMLGSERLGSVGRIASWASWTFFDFCLNCRGRSSA